MTYNWAHCCLHQILNLAVLVATAHLLLKQSSRICLWTILPGERASGRNHQFQTEELVPSIPKILSDVFLNSNTLVCLSLSTGTRLRWRSIATSSPFRKKTHHHFYDSTHGWHGWTVWTNNAVEILQRKVSWARVPEIVLQNDPVLFRPKSKKMAGNSIVTFNVVTS